jgi:hypothetical protein
MLITNECDDIDKDKLLTFIVLFLIPFNHTWRYTEYQKLEWNSNSRIEIILVEILLRLLDDTFFRKKIDYRPMMNTSLAQSNE